LNEKLKIITEKTIVKLLKEEIVLPTTYFKTFKENSENLNVSLDDKNFEQEISKILQIEADKINTLMDKTMSHIDTLSKETTNAKNAIEQNDKNQLEKITKNINELQKEVNALMEQVYLDALTKTKNKKWIFNKYLNNTDKFQNDGILLSIQINDIAHITKQYGEILANNVLKYICNFIDKKLANENIEYTFCRYTNDTFFIFIHNQDIRYLNSLLKNFQNELMKLTLKSNSGVILKTSFEYILEQFYKNDNFYSLLENLNQKGSDFHS
jgi:GGDEF domain-containing protein